MFLRKKDPLSKSKPPKKEQLKLLPPGGVVGEYPQEVTSARNLLSVYAIAGTKGEAIVKEVNKSKKEDKLVKRSIAYHYSSSYVDEEPLDLARALVYTDSFTILLRALRRSPESFDDHIKFQKNLSTADERAKFLEDVQEWAFPVRDSQIFGHDMLLWGPSNAFLPVAREETAALYGDIVKYTQLGSMMRSVIYGTPMDRSETWFDPTTGAMDPTWYAAPRRVLWYPRYYILPDVNTAYSFWSGLVTKSNIAALLGMGDLLIQAERVNKMVYFSSLLRVGVPLKTSDGTSYEKPDFSDYSRQLIKLGKWEQRNGADVRESFKAFIPGSPPHRAWHRHSVMFPIEVMRHLSRPLKTTGDPNGNIMMGVIDDQPLLLDPWTRPGTLIEGPSKVGKTTLGAALVNQVGANIVWLPLTATDRGESAIRWCEEMGGSVYQLNLPDVILKSDNGTPPDNKTIQKKQLELHTSDREDAKEMVLEMAEKWHARGKIVGLPLTFDILSGNTIRLFNWYDAFLKAFLEVWSHWYTNYGEQLILVADNFSALNKSRNQIPYGDIPHNTGKNLGNTLAYFVSNARNNGIATWVLTHTKEDLAQINSGLYGQFGLHISLNHDNHSYADFILPKDSEQLASHVWINLPQPIKKRFERLEPKKEDKPWRQKVSSAVS